MTPEHGQHSGLGFSHLLEMFGDHWITMFGITTFLTFTGNVWVELSKMSALPKRSNSSEGIPSRSIIILCKTHMALTRLSALSGVVSIALSRTLNLLLNNPKALSIQHLARDNR